MTLDETVTCFGFEEVFLCGSVPVRSPRAQGRLWGARFDVDASPVFPQGVLAAAIWVRAGLAMEKLELEPAVRTVSSVLSDCPRPSGAGPAPTLLE